MIFLVVRALFTKPLYLAFTFAICTLLFLQTAVPALAFSTTVTSGEPVVLTSSQITDVRNACISLGLGGSTYCKTVSQRTIAVRETDSPDITIRAAETKAKRFSTTLAGAVIGAEAIGITFATLSGDGRFEGAVDHLVTKPWGTIYFENGQKSNKVLMTIQVSIDTVPAAWQLGSISGTVTDSANGIALEGATVTAIMQGSSAVKGQATTDANGRYSIGALEPGTYYLEATAPSYQSRTYQGVVVSAGSDTVRDVGLTIAACPDRAVKHFKGVALIDELLGRRESGGASSTPEYVTESMHYIKQNGFTAIRVPFYWESYVYNSTEFLDRVDLIARSAADNDLCVFYANFQFYTTSQWNGITTKPPGRGFPSFVVQNFPPVNNDYIQTAAPFWDAFLGNNIQIDNKNVWDVQADFFRTVIEKVDHHSSVAGYEILNEPHLFDPMQYEKLGNYHTYMAQKIREVTGKKIYFDREVTFGFTRDPSLEQYIVPRGVAGIVYAPHLYAIPYPGSQGEQQIENFESLSQQWGSEVLIGETVADTQQDAEQLLSVLKQKEFGWTVWSWKPTVSTGLGRTYFESSTVPPTEVLQILVAAMNKIY